MGMGIEASLLPARSDVVLTGFKGFKGFKGAVSVNEAERFVLVLIFAIR